MKLVKRRLRPALLLLIAQISEVDLVLLLVVRVLFFNVCVCVRACVYTFVMDPGFEFHHEG